MSVFISPYYNSQAKRLFDIVLGLILLTLALPVMAVLSLFISVSSGRPVIFKQRRTGLNKEPFTIYKFRTMQQGAALQRKKYNHLNQAPSPMFKIFNDPRFVGPGRLMSASGLDELPQLINIIKGEMSFIGPRPLPINEAKQLAKNWDFRFNVKPGLISFWTLSPKRHKSLTKWRQLEIKTLARGGWRFEMSLIIKIIPNLIKGLFGR